MPVNGEVEGRLGDVSGRLGDVSGRLGDVSGRLGDVSGRATSEEFQDFLLQDRQADRLRFAEGRISRLESETVLIVRWINSQLALITQALTTDSTKDDVTTLKQDVQRLRDQLTQVEDELNK